jgi:peroxiredoxin
MQFPPDEASGWHTLHQMFSVDWLGLAELPAEKFNQCVDSFAALIKEHESLSGGGQSAAFHLLGHKGPLCLMHFRPSFDLCASFELALARLPISKYISIKNSYTSIVELGMYHVSKKIVSTMLEKGVKPYSDEWNEEYEAKIAPHRPPLHERCFTEIPDLRYFCFYPMNKRRGEKFNWYMEPLDSRAKYMMEHGMTGRRYAGKVKQIITGSVGFDAWEWGVDLFTDNPMHIKRLVYEMRFDDATSMFGEFGDFYFGIRLKSQEFRSYFNGEIPRLDQYSAAVNLTAAG